MAAVGSLRAQQGRPGPQALRQPACGRSADGAADGARRLHAAPGGRERLGGALGPDRGQRPRRQGHVLRSRPGQGLPPSDLLPAAAFGGPHRLGEWCGHAPILEEDIAMTNMALDLVGQARALLTRAGQLEGRAHDEDQLAFLRDERDYFNATLAELPRGDFAFTCAQTPWPRLDAPLNVGKRSRAPGDTELAAIAAKALKDGGANTEQHAVMGGALGDGTPHRGHAHGGPRWPSLWALRGRAR
ncbi:hypothetical protein FQR65_LT20495 [Abscondita terminalis]|nr:hypothetical protein FQR65_LT20495 [Abscondita terminalis]